MPSAIATKKLMPITRTTTVFTSGNSQAVRLPKEFRVNSKTLNISRRGEEIVLREQPRTVAQVLAELPTPTDAEINRWEKSLREIKKENLFVEERDFDWRSGESTAPLKHKSEAKSSRIRTKPSLK